MGQDYLATTGGQVLGFGFFSCGMGVADARLCAEQIRRASLIGLPAASPLHFGTHGTLAT